MTWVAKAAVTVALTIWVLGLALSVINILILVVMAAVLAIGLDPAVRWLQRMNMRRGHAVAIIFVSAVLLTVLFVWLVVPPLIRQMNGLSNDIPTYAQRLERRDDAIGRYFREHAVVQRLKDFVADLPSRVVSSFSQILGVAGKVTSAVFNFTTVAILMLYLLLSLPSLKKTSAMMVSKDWQERTTQVADQAVAKIGGFVSGNILTALICAFVTLIALASSECPTRSPSRCGRVSRISSRQSGPTSARSPRSR